MKLFAPMSDLTSQQRKISNRAVQFSLGVLAAVGFAMGAPARANINDMEEHQRLWNVLQDSGVTLVVNSPAYCSDDVAGLYGSTEKLLFICQQNAEIPYREVEWTSYDLDTLRHEAHHVVQDCMAGKLGDQEFGLLFNDADELTSFVERGLSPKQIDMVLSMYEESDDFELLMELEAFATANSVDADTIADGINNVCGANYDY
jgi:hypothetical protein